jgi:hypothetical protein
MDHVCHANGIILPCSLHLAAMAVETQRHTRHARRLQMPSWLFGEGQMQSALMVGKMQQLH